MILLFVTDHAALHKWVDAGEVRVILTSADERDTVVGQTSVSPGVPMTPSGVGGQNGPILLKPLSKIVLNATGRLLGRMRLCYIDVIVDEADCLVFSYTRFLRSLATVH